MNPDGSEFLRCTPAFWSRLGFCYDPPRRDRDGGLMRLCRPLAEHEEMHRKMYAAGIRVHSSILFSGWTGVGEFDYEWTDRTLESIFSCGENLLYIPRIKLNVPLSWCAANPEELCVYFDGPRDAAAIRALVGGPRQDILGYNSVNGYTVPGDGFHDDRPNVNGVIALQSVSSEKWLTDAADALRRLMEHIRNDTPYGERILAYHFAYGPCGETSVWGQWSFLPVPDSGYLARCGDYGIAHREHFTAWLLRRCGSLAALRERWRMPELTLDNLTVPPPALRETGGERADELFRRGNRHRPAIDYELFMEDCQVRALDCFGRTIHQYSDKLAGAFSGYFIDVPRSAYSGNGATSVLTRTREVDFFASPKSYYRNAIGEAGGEQGAAQSVNLYRVWMDEIDNGTHLDFARSQCRTIVESRYLMWREAAKNLAHNSGCWWMDLGNGWYDDAELLAEIKTITEAGRIVMAQPHRRVAQILLLVDDSALPYMKVNFPLHEKILGESIREASLLGAPVDLFRWDDLERIECDQYRMVILLNAFRFSAARRRQLDAKLGGAIRLWQYAPGMIEGAAEVPFAVVEHDAGGLPYPAFRCRETADIDVWERHDDGTLALARKGRDFYTSDPALPAAKLRRLGEWAGCDFRTPCGNIVYGDERFIAIFSGRNPEGFPFELPVGKGDWHDWRTRTDYPGGSRLKLGSPWADWHFFTLGRMNRK